MTSSFKRKRIRKEDILSFLPLLFQSADAGKLTSAPQLFLNRARKRGDISQIIRGYYLNSWKSRIIGKEPSIEEVACFVRRPSYVSCEWALNIHNILDQAPRVCTVITLSSSVGKRNRINLGDTVIEYSKIKPELFTGFEFIDGAHIARPEKAILDTLYLRRQLPVMDELNWQFVDFEKLKTAAHSYPKSVRDFLSSLVP